MRFDLLLVVAFETTNCLRPCIELLFVLAPFTGHLYSTADIRNPRRRPTPMHGFAISKTGTGEAVRIETLETLEREMC
jgi:hypothetical protein